MIATEVAAQIRERIKNLQNNPRHESMFVDGLKISVRSRNGKNVATVLGVAELPGTVECTIVELPASKSLFSEEFVGYLTGKIDAETFTREGGRRLSGYVLSIVYWLREQVDELAGENRIERAISVSDELAGAANHSISQMRRGPGVLI